MSLQGKKLLWQSADRWGCAALTVVLFACGSSKATEISGEYQAWNDGSVETATFLPGHAAQFKHPQYEDRTSFNIIHAKYTREENVVVMDFGAGKKIFQVVDERTLTSVNDRGQTITYSKP